MKRSFNKRCWPICPLLTRNLTNRQTIRHRHTASFWLNDPVPAAMGGIGEDSYKTVNELLATYYFPLTTGDSYDGEYVAICEPPDPVEAPG